MATALDIANVFLCLSEPEVGDVVTNLKVQKLVYYAQGFHLAMFGKPLFEEQIMAWEHGPVVADLYHHFKGYGSSALPLPEGFEIEKSVTPEQFELIKEVQDVYGQFSAWKLRNLTHSERPWLETARNTVIPNELLTEYFATQIAGN